jgi:hypothetical protein
MQKRLEELNWRTQPRSFNNGDQGEVVEVFDSKPSYGKPAYFVEGASAEEDCLKPMEPAAECERKTCDFYSQVVPCATSARSGSTEAKAEKSLFQQIFGDDDPSVSSQRISRRLITRAIIPINSVSSTESAC